MGFYEEHKDYGQQFRATSYECEQPANEAGIVAFLASGLVRGVGEVLSTRIVDAFGADALQVLKTQPERAAQIKGISLSLAKDIAKSLSDHEDVRGVIVNLAGLGISVTQALKAYEAFGAAAADVIKKNPYALVEAVFGIGFDRADAIAARLGFEKKLRFSREGRHQAHA